MILRGFASLGLLLWALLFSAAHAVTFRIDDSATSTHGVARMHWRQLAPGKSLDNVMEGNVGVRVRLNTAAWLGRAGRIFLNLPSQPLGIVRASWPAHQRFLAGTLSSGQRALIYSGLIMSPVTEGQLLLKLEVDGTRMEGVRQIDFYFELDLDQ